MSSSYDWMKEAWARFPDRGDRVVIECTWKLLEQLTRIAHELRSIHDEIGYERHQAQREESRNEEERLKQEQQAAFDAAQAAGVDLAANHLDAYRERLGYKWFHAVEVALTHPYGRMKSYGVGTLTWDEFRAYLRAADAAGRDGVNGIKLDGVGITTLRAWKAALEDAGDLEHHQHDDQQRPQAQRGQE